MTLVVTNYSNFIWGNYHLALIFSWWQLAPVLAYYMIRFHAIMMRGSHYFTTAELWTVCPHCSQSDIFSVAEIFDIILQFQFMSVICCMCVTRFFLHLIYHFLTPSCSSLSLAIPTRGLFVVQKLKSKVRKEGHPRAGYGKENSTACACVYCFAFPKTLFLILILYPYITLNTEPVSSL